MALWLCLPRALPLVGITAETSSGQKIALVQKAGWLPGPPACFPGLQGCPGVFPTPAVFVQIRENLSEMPVPGEGQRRLLIIDTDLNVSILHPSAQLQRSLQKFRSYLLALSVFSLGMLGKEQEVPGDRKHAKVVGAEMGSAPAGLGSGLPLEHKSLLQTLPLCRQALLPKLWGRELGEASRSRDVHQISALGDYPKSTSLTWT